MPGYLTAEFPVTNFIIIIVTNLQYTIIFVLPSNIRMYTNFNIRVLKNIELVSRIILCKVLNKKNQYICLCPFLLPPHKKNL